MFSKVLREKGFPLMALEFLMEFSSFFFGVVLCLEGGEENFFWNDRSFMVECFFLRARDHRRCVLYLPEFTPAFGN